MQARSLIMLSGLMCLASPATGQVFQKTYGSPMFNFAFGIAPTADGGAVMVGRMNGTPPSLGLMLAKLDSRGEPRWVKSYLARAAANSVQQTMDGGYILGGTVRVGSSGIDDAFLLRTDADGEPLWSAVYGAAGSTARADAVIETTDGGFAFAGSVGIPGGPVDAYFVRTDGHGNVVWARTYAGASASSLLATSDGGFLLVGGAGNAATGNADALVIKTDAAGMPNWSKVYGGSGTDWGAGAVELGGGYLVALATLSFGAGGFDAALISLDSLGNVLGGSTYGSPLSESPTGMVRTSDGDIVIAGLTDASTGPMQGFALRIGASGALRWSKFFATSAFHSQAAAVDGGSWMVGWQVGAPGQMFVVKVNEDGATTCADPDAGFVTGAMALVVGNGPASSPGPGIRSAGNVGVIAERLDTSTLCFCEGARRVTYGAGWRGTFGVPALVAFDRPVLGRTVALHAGNSLGAMTPGLLLLGRQRLDLVTPFEGTLLVQIELGLGVAVGANGAQVSLTIPDDATLCGLSVFAQVLELDGGATRGVSFTPGLELQFGM